MSDPNSPYQTPQSFPPVTPPQFPMMVAKPTAATVFGILDVVIAAWGALGVLMIVGEILFFKNFFSATPELKASASFFENPGPLLATTAVGIIVIVPMIVAGIQLLKGRRTAITWSNRYSACSIVAKFITAGISITFMAPRMQELAKTNPLPSPSFFYSTGYFVICAVVGMIYPILAYVFLNRPRVKEWFAAQPV